MSNKFLVTFASRAGSTAGIADAVGMALSEHGAQVDVCTMQDVTDLAPYRAVVAGSAIQEGKWLPEAMQFMRTHQAALAQKPFAAFLVCMTLAIKNENYHRGVVDWLQPVRAMVKPVSEGFFAGALDLDKVPSFRQRMMFRISIHTGVWSEGDHRDWNAVQAWADELAAKFQL